MTDLDNPPINTVDDALIHMTEVIKALTPELQDDEYYLYIALRILAFTYACFIGE